MAISLLTTGSTNAFHPSAGTYTTSLGLTLSSGTNTGLYVYINWGGNVTVLTVFWNTTSAMTNVSGTNWWYLANPTITSANVDVSWTLTGGNAAEIAVLGAQYNHTKQTSIPDSHSSGSGGSGTTFSTTVVAAGAWILWGANDAGQNSISASGWQRNGQQDTSPGGGAGFSTTAFGDSNGTVGIGSQGTSFTNTQGNFFNVVDLISIAPDVAPAAPAHAFMLLMM